MAASATEHRSSPSLGKLLLGCVGVVVILGGIIVLLNWQSIRRLAQTATHALGELHAVQREVASTYATPNVQVHYSRESGVAGAVLDIQVINSPLLRGLSDPAAEQRAREIAELALRTLQESGRYQIVQVTIGTQMGAAAWVGKHQTFTFSASDLAPRPRTGSEGSPNPSLQRTPPG
jgi:hypothetical protein